MKKQIEVFVQQISGLLLTLFFLAFTACSPCGRLSDADAIQCMQNLPKEDVRAIPKVAEYLGKHKVYISLSTSPLRIATLPEVLRSIDLSLVESVLLVLPNKFRNLEEYKIPSSILNYPKLRLIRIEKDLGVITKLLPALDLVKDDPDAIVVTVDDDVAYPAGMVGQLVKHAILDDTVVGGHGRNIEFFGLDQQAWPEIWQGIPDCGTDDFSTCDMLEGVGGVAYKPKYFDIPRLMQLSQRDSACRKSDDLVISYALAERAVKRLSIKNEFYPFVTPLSLGFGADALHHEDGSIFANAGKYQKCLESLKQVP